jgi:hypothetical protein
VPSQRALKFAILEFLNHYGRRNKWNTIGRSGQVGDLELRLRINFNAELRARAAHAWDALQAADYIRSDYGSLSDPADWVELTPKGSRALERHALDDLDEILHGAGARLVELRDAAWAALDQPGDGAYSQSASSMCEVVDQLLHSLAPAEAVRIAPWFKLVPESRDGVTRRQRARLVMERRHGRHDDDRCSALVAAQDELTRLKHARVAHEREDVAGALRFAEDALRQVLLWPTRDEGPPANRPDEGS